jgi:hypothetical protein
LFIGNDDTCAEVHTVLQPRRLTSNLHHCDNLRSHHINAYLQAQYRYESRFTPVAVPTAAPASAPPSYPLNPTEVPVARTLRGSLYPALSNYMGLDLSPQALAELVPEYAVAIPQSVSGD